MAGVSKVLVVGAGVGGMTLARTMRHLKMDVKVFDRAHDRHAQANRGLGLWDNSQLCLRSIGMAPFLDSHARFVPPAAYRSVDGTWLSRCSNTPKNQRRVACVEQAQLLSVLEHGISGNDSIHVEWGKQVVAVDETSKPDSVVLHFADGTSEEGGLVVGADGADSGVRERVFPEAAAQWTQTTCFSAVVDRPATDPPFETLGSIHPAGFPAPSKARFACVPLLGERLFWFASVHVPRFAEEAVPEEEEALLEWLGEAYAGWHAPIGDVIAAGHGAAHVLREDVLELHQPLPAWTSPSLNLALLGDAAHPLSPNLAQGAAVAVEEAVELGHLLAGQVGAGQGHKGALRHWERRRRARAAACSRVTGFTKLLAAHPALAVAMALVPPAINAPVFDLFLDHSLYAGGPFQPPPPPPPPPPPSPRPH